MTDESISPGPADGEPELPLPAVVRSKVRKSVDGVAVINSVDVAADFGKPHKNVLRDIRKILHGSDLSHVKDQWFRQTISEHPMVKGRFDKSFDMPIMGYMLLIKSWAGKQAMAVAICHFQQLEALEKALRDATNRPLDVGNQIAGLHARLDRIEKALSEAPDAVKRLKDNSLPHVIEATAKRAARYVAEDVSSAEKRRMGNDGHMIKGIIDKRFREHEDKARATEQKTKNQFDEAIKKIASLVAPEPPAPSDEDPTSIDIIEMVLGSIPEPLPAGASQFVSRQMDEQFKKMELKKPRRPRSRQRVPRTHPLAIVAVAMNTGLPERIRKWFASRSVVPHLPRLRGDAAEDTAHL